MAAHRLHRANVRAVLEEVGREGMADDVRGDSLSDAGLSCIVFYDSLHTAAVQTAEFFASIFFFIFCRSFLLRFLHSNKQSFFHVLARGDIFLRRLAPAPK